MKIFNKIAKTYNIVLEHIPKVMAGVILALLVIVCIQVFARYLPIPPVLWTTDIAMYCLIVLGFLGIGWLLRKGAHVAIDIAVESLPFRGKHMIGMLTSVIGAVTTLIVACFAGFVVTNQFSRGIFVTGSLFNTPKWMLLVFIPIGFAFAFIEFVALFRGHMLAFKKRKGSIEGTK
jgi:TRAP-type C4-dicarboxylate transport system permease small subunit